MVGKIEAEGVDAEAVEVIERVLRAWLGPLGFSGASVVPGQDHDGDPVLYIEAQYDLTPEPIDPRATFGIIRALREALEEVGETRFPHLRHHFDDRQKVAARR